MNMQITKVSTKILLHEKFLILQVDDLNSNLTKFQFNESEVNRDQLWQNICIQGVPIKITQ